MVLFHPLSMNDCRIFPNKVDFGNAFRRRGRDGIIPTTSGEATSGRNYEFSTSHERQFQFTTSGEATSGRNCN
jgi:hypothetical protein